MGVCPNLKLVAEQRAQDLQSHECRIDSGLDIDALKETSVLQRGWSVPSQLRVFGLTALGLEGRGRGHP